MKTVFTLLAACGLSLSAHAGCYSVYSPAGHLVHQSSEAPVDTRYEYHRTVPQRFGPGSTLVYVNDNQHCTELVGLRVGLGNPSPARASRADRG